jgi:hypothetical protein
MSEGWEYGMDRVPTYQSSTTGVDQTLIGPSWNDRVSWATMHGNTMAWDPLRGRQRRSGVWSRHRPTSAGVVVTRSTGGAGARWGCSGGSSRASLPWWPGCGSGRWQASDG